MVLAAPTQTNAIRLYALRDTVIRLRLLGDLNSIGDGVPLGGVPAYRSNSHPSRPR